MKSIKLSEYPNDGILIDLEDNYSYQQWHDKRAINIPYNELIYNFATLLDKSKKYYVYCRRGSKSRRLASILEIYNYDVTQVLLDN